MSYKKFRTATLLGITSLFALSIKGQNMRGIVFSTEKWEAVKQIAKQESKYIFLDCFTTWCLPCKQMDEMVYSDDSVGRIINDKFISVKVQMDTTKNDPPFVQEWRSVAARMQKEFAVYSFPTYLFLSPEGKIVHRSLGFMVKEKFLELARDATDSDKQVYTLLEKYRANTLDPQEMLPLAEKVSEVLKDVELGGKIGNGYLTKYLYKQSEKEILLPHNVEAMVKYMESSSEKGFELFYNYPNLIDSISSPYSVARLTTEKIITNENIKPELAKAEKTNSTPDWKSIYKKIRNKYKEDVSFSATNNSQLFWLLEKKKYAKAMDVYIKRIEKMGLDTSGFIGRSMVNNMCYELFFKHGTKHRHLNSAIRWMEVVLKGLPDDSNFPIAVDTYANLLYKASRVNDAILWQHIAVNREEHFANQYKRVPRPDFRNALEKMEKRQPTWTDVN